MPIWRRMIVVQIVGVTLIANRKIPYMWLRQMIQYVEKTALHSKPSWGRFDKRQHS